MKKRGRTLISLLVLIDLALLLLVVFFYSSFILDYKAGITGFAIQDEYPNATIVDINMSQEIGVVREDFYGTNTHGQWGSNLSFIDVDANNAYDTYSDYQWHRNALEDAKITYLRIDMALSDVSFGEGIFNTTRNLTNYGNIETRKNTIIYAKANDMKVMLIAAYMPTWLQNRSGNCGASGEWDKCPPNNYTKWGELVVDYLQYVGCDADTCEVEVWNEPDLDHSWLDNLSETAENAVVRANTYVLLYNATYDAVKAAYPGMAVGGPALASTYLERGQYFYPVFLANMSNKMDFFSWHRYRYTADEGLADPDFDVMIKNEINMVLANCSLYGANCSRLVLGEWNEHNASHQVNETDKYAEQVALAYLGVLNSYPANLTMIQYQWAEFLNYSQGSAYYGEYPQRWTMVAEPKLENTYYPPYNVTKSFATYHSAGSMVVKSNSSSSNIKVVASKKDDSLYITVINTGAEVNVGLNIYGEEISQIKDLETDEIYNVTEGGVYIGPISQYQIRYFTNISAASPPEEELNQLLDNNFMENNFMDNSMGLEEENNLTENTSEEENLTEDYGGGSGGSNSIESEEECNDSYLITQTCEGLGYASGVLSFGSGCTLDASRCIPYLYDEGDSVGPVKSVLGRNLEEEEDNTGNNKETGNTNTLSALFDNQKIFSFANLILLILLLCISGLMILIARILIKRRKYDNLKMLLLT